LDKQIKNNSTWQEDNLVSVIIPSFYTKGKNPELLLSCLRSIFFSTYPKHEVIIIDDNSEVDISNFLSNFQVKEKVTIIRNKHNLGYGASCNRGAMIAKGEYILFLNDDMEISSNLLEALIKEIKKYPNVGILFSKEINYGNPSAVSTGCLMDSLGNTLARRNTKQGTIFYAPGAPCFMKTSVFFEVGGFDESFYLFYEDVDLSWRVRLKGYDIKYIDEAFVLHFGSSTIGGFSPTRIFLYQRNALRMFIKNLHWKSLPMFVVGYIVQSCLLLIFFSLERKPEFVFSILKAYLSNFKDFKTLIIQRRLVQSMRKVSDSELMKYISPGWFLWYRFKERKKYSSRG
jgi:GT2 family glycosyltransferase